MVEVTRVDSRFLNIHLDWEMLNAKMQAGVFCTTRKASGLARFFHAVCPTNRANQKSTHFGKFEWSTKEATVILEQVSEH